MPAKSVAQRKFMGMVRATQKGEMKNPSPELKRAAGDMSAKAVNKFAKTKEKNLPQKVEEAYAVQAMTVVPGGADHSNTRQGSIGKKKKKEEIKEFVGAAAAGTAGALTAKKGNRVKKAVGSGAGYAVGSTVGRKVGGAVGQAVGSGTVPIVGGAIGKQVGKAIGHGVGGAAGAIAGGKLATKVGKKKEKKETNEEMQLEKFSSITKKRINKMAADKKVGKGEKIGSVVGGIGGALALGAVDGPLPVGDVVGGVVGSKIGGKIGKQFDKKKVKKEEYMDEAKYEAGASTYGKASIRNKRKFGKGGNAAPPEERGEMIAKRREEHKASRGVKKEEIDRPYTGPDKKDRAVIKKMDNKDFAKKAAEYEKNMDPKKRQELKDKATKGMKFTVEAMSSYDRNRKAAAKRAAARNAERRAGKRGGRMEGETYRTEGGVHMHHKGYKAEGMSYGLYKGSGKPSGPMAAFGKKNKLNKPETKKKKVQSFKKFKAGQEPASASAPDMSEATLATARKNIGRDPKKKSCWKGYKATGTKMKDGRAVPDCKPA